MRAARDMKIRYRGSRSAKPPVLRRGPVLALGALVAASVLAGATGGRAETPAAASEGARPPAAAPAPGEARRDLLAPGDRLTITILDQPDLSGSFLVEPTGEVAIPLLGPVAAAGTSVEDLRASLATRFAAGYLQNPNVVVRLAELRPVTVVGGVRTPGRYAFLEGMTVATALALSGGLSVLTGEEALARADFLTAEQQLSAQEVNRLGQLARRARLEASIAGKDIDPPAVEPGEKEMFARFLATEQRVLASSRDNLARQHALLAEQSKQITTDIDVFNQQLTLEREQDALLDQQVDSTRKLLSNGLTRQASLVDLERERSRSRGNLAQLTGSLARARSLQVEAQFRLDQIETVARDADIASLQTVNQQIAESEATIPIVRELRDVRRARLSRMPAASAAPPELSLTRFQDGAFQRRPARPGDIVWPGDVVQVGSDDDVLQAVASPLAEAPASALGRTGPQVADTTAQGGVETTAQGGVETVSATAP